MPSPRLFLPAICLLALVAPTTQAESTDQPVVGIRLVPNSDVYTHLANVWLDYVPDKQGYQEQPITSVEMEIRRVKGNVQLVRAPFNYALANWLNDQRPGELPMPKRPIPQEILREVGSFGPGEYQLALLVNGVRASNVVNFRIDSNHATYKRPALEFGTLEPHPLAKDSQPLLFIRGRKKQDMQLTYDNLTRMPLVVDGKEAPASKVPRPRGQIHPTADQSMLLDLANYQFPYEPGKAYQLATHFPPYPQAVLDFDPGVRSLAKEWDANTATIKTLDDLQPMLMGTILTQDGKMGVDYKISLLHNKTGESYDAYGDKTGRYRFYDVEPRDYQFSARLPFSSDEVRSIGSSVEIRDGNPLTIPLDFGGHHTISGTVVDNGGRPIEDLTVVAHFSDPNSNLHAIIYGKTGKDGVYVIQGPYENIMSLEPVSHHWKAEKKWNLKAGDTADFTVTPR